MNISGKLMLSPMAGITDAAFRSLCVDFGADMTVTELVSAHSLLYGGLKTNTLIQRADNESCFGIQLFGSDPGVLSRAACAVEDRCDFIDINMGCPAPKVWRNGAGSALLSKPALISDILSSVSDAVSVPVSAKIRTGISDHSLAHTALRACRDGGASWVTVHARTRDQGYSGRADWSVIESLNQNHSIPVIGNGDLHTPSDITSAFHRGVNAVAVGRGASGNPWLFSRDLQPESASKRRIVFFDYLDRAKRYAIPFSHQKLQAQHFIKGLHGARELRNSLSKASTPSQLHFLFSSL